MGIVKIMNKYQRISIDFFVQREFRIIFLANISPVTRARGLEYIRTNTAASGRIYGV